MTLTSLFAAGPSAREPPSMGDNLDYYGIDRGGHGWKGKSEMKKTKSTLSALTLLAFLFFLNLLLTCLKDTIQGNDPEIIVVPQQRVTRRVSGQLVNILADPGVPVLSSPALSPIQSNPVGGDAAVEKEDAAGMTLIDDTSLNKDGQRIRRTKRSHRGDEDDEGVSVETDWDGGRGHDAQDTTDVDEADEEYSSIPEEDEEEGAKTQKRIDELRTKLWPCCSDADTGLKTRRERMIPEKLADLGGEDYETSIETPETMQHGDKVADYDYTAAGYDGKKMGVFYGPTLGPLDYTGVEPEYLGWETVDDTSGDKGERTGEEYVLADTGTRVEDEGGVFQWGSSQGAGKSRLEDRSKGNKYKKNEGLVEESEDAGRNVEVQEDGGNKTEDGDEGKVFEEDSLKDKTSQAVVGNVTKQLSAEEKGIEQALQLFATDPLHPLWELLRVLLDGFGRRFAAKGWEESLDSMQHPGMGFFHLGKQLMNYAMPILRETTQKFGGFDPARCKELVVCETSRLAWMWGDEDVTSAFNGVFEWVYGMEEPELRSINREWRKQKKKSCRNFIKRCKAEAGEGSWLPMIANVLEYFVT